MSFATVKTVGGSDVVINTAQIRYLSPSKTGDGRHITVVHFDENHDIAIASSIGEACILLCGS